MTRAKAYAAACPVAISGSDGHGQTFALTCSLVNGFGLDENVALEVLREWNAGCMPPWSEKELRHKVRQALKANHAKPHGHLLNAGQPSSHREATAIAPPAEKSVWKIERRTSPRIVEPTPKHPSESSEVAPSVDTATLCEMFAPLVAVPNCTIGRPPDIEIADADWRAVVASGLAMEEQVQHALFLFGSGCRVISYGKEGTAPCAS